MKGNRNKRFKRQYIKTGSKIYGFILEYHTITVLENCKDRQGREEVINNSTVVVSKMFL